MLTTQLRDFFPEARVLGLDIETTGLNLWEDHITAIALSDGNDAVVVDVRGMPRVVVADWLWTYVFWRGNPSWEGREARKIVVHFARFDLPFLKEYVGAEYPADVWDTLIGEKLLTAGMFDDTGRLLDADLQTAVQRRLGLEISKDHDIRTGFQLDSEWTPEQIAYAETDAQVLVPLYEAQARAIRREGMDTIARIEMAAVPVFAEMYRRGVLIDLERLTPLLDEARAKAAAEEERLQLLLTPYEWFERKRDNAAEEEKLAAWRARYDAAAREYAHIWSHLILEGFDYARDRLRDWVGTELENGKVIDEKEVESWLDLKVPKGKFEPAGCSRFVKRMLYLWRRQPGNERPQTKVAVLDTPINMRSIKQKMRAIQLYIDEVNAELGTAFQMPPDLQRKSLTAASVDAPEPIKQDLLLPLIEFSRYDKIVSSFGDALLSLLHPERQTLHGNWNQIGAATGRPSCERPNMLNMPRNDAFRGCFRARPGHAFIVADYSQMELRLLAEMSGDPTMIELLCQDRDLHLETAADIYSVPPEQVQKEQRVVAKMVNFGIPYGIAEMGLRRNLAGERIFITDAEATRILSGWRRKFSTAARWLERQQRQGLSRGWTATALGRRRYFETWRPDMPRAEQGKIQREAGNHPIQGSNADITKLAMVAIQREVAPLGGSVLMQIYDEIVVEVPEQYAEQAREVVVAAMTMAAQTVLKRVPVKVDAVISPTWSEKEAVEVA